MAPFISFIVVNLIVVSQVHGFNIYNEDDYTPENFMNISSPCFQQYNASDLMTLLQLFDASVKIPEGIGNGNFFHLGNFDECYSLESKTVVGTVYGKYCLGTIPITSLTSKKYDFRNKFAELEKINLSPIKPRMLGTNPDQLGIHLGYCIPNACTAEDVEKMTLGFVKFDEQYCESKATERKLDSGAIATITVLAIFLGLLAVSTAYDVVLYYTEKKPAHELLISFSAFTNGKKLITASTNADQLLCLNGIRALSMMWVIVGHLYSNSMGSAISNYFYLMDFEKDAKNMIILGATVSVDTFFAAGGLVTVYTFLKAADKGVKFNIILYYIHRYLRLTPALAIIVLMHATLSEYMGQGPLWNATIPNLAETCQKYWWSTLLYIQNFVNVKNTCVPQSWYLSVDFQIFLLSPIVLLPLKWKPKTGLSILGVLIAAGAIIPFVIGYVYKIPAFNGTTINNTDEDIDKQLKYYGQTHTRFGPYVIGILAGYFIYKMKKNNIKINLHPIATVSIWLVIITGLVACVFSYHDHIAYDRVAHSLALAFLRNAWGICVCGVVFMCVSGYGGIIDWFLSLPVFQFLTKLSYSMYLTHYGWICIRLVSVKTPFELSNGYMLWSFWGDFMLTLGVSLILCLTFESPVVILEKYIFKSGASKAQKAATAPTEITVESVKN